MTAWFRLIGIGNAALWFGTTLFFTFVVGPAFFSNEMLSLFGWPKTGQLAKYYSGAVAQIILERYFIVHYICGGIALVHLMIEWLYTGRPWKKITLLIILCMLSLSLSGGMWIQPKLQRLFRTMYGGAPQQVEEARRVFKVWHGVSQGINLLLLGGTLAVLWQISREPEGLRYSNRVKFGLG